MEIKRAVIYFDGACLPHNPGGIATYGFVVKNTSGDTVFRGKGVAAEQGTNNIAEYTGLIEALKKAKEMGIEQVKIYGDSMLVVNQINGVYGVRSKNIYSLYETAKKLLSQFSDWKIQWVARKNNKEADKLSTEAFIEYIENKNRQRIEKLRREIVIFENGYFKIKDYVISLNPLSCNCQYFQRINSSSLLKKDNIVVKCKHILYVEEFTKSRGENTWKR